MTRKRRKGGRTPSLQATASPPPQKEQPRTAAAPELDEHGLTLLQRRWADAYLRHGNKTQATIDAGYQVADRASAAQIGYANHQLEAIRKYIADRLASEAMESSEILARLAAHARGSLELFLKVGEDGDFHLDLKKAEEACALGLLKKLKVRRTGEDTELVEVELHDAQAALRQLGLHLGLWKPDGSVDLTVNLSGDTLKKLTEQAGEELDGWQPRLKRRS